MTANTEMTRLDRGSFQEVLGGGPSTTVPLIARPVVVLTAGRIEYAARCPSCQNWHRHVSLGKKTGPCGARYLLQPKSKLRGAA